MLAKVAKTITQTIIVTQTTIILVRITTTILTETITTSYNVHNIVQFPGV